MQTLQKLVFKSNLLFA